MNENQYVDVEQGAYLHPGDEMKKPLSEEWIPMRVVWGDRHTQLFHVRRLDSPRTPLYDLVNLALDIKNELDDELEREKFQYQCDALRRSFINSMTRLIEDGQKHVDQNRVRTGNEAENAGDVANARSLSQ